MSSLSKEEYLKRYLSPADAGEKPKKKRKKKVKTIQGKGFKIVDDDAMLEEPVDNDELEMKFLTEEEKPVIENLDVRTEEEKELDRYRRSKMWKAMGASEEDDDEDGVVSLASVKKKRKKEKKKRYDSDSDIDVPRKKVNESDSDLDVPRGNTMNKVRHDSDSDLDLPRGGDSRKKSNRHDSDSDIDVPRNKTTRQRRDNDDSDLDLPRNGRRNKNDSDSDLEVTRRTKSSRDNNDQRSKRNNEASKKHSKHSRSRHDSDSDISVERNTRHNNEKSIDKKKKGMIGGGAGGLTSVTDLRKEMEERKKQESELDKLATEYKNAKAVYREKGTGKRIDKEKEQKEKDEKAEKRRQKEEKYSRWGGGVKQAELKASAVADTIHESNKPLARYNDDEDLETMRRAEMRAEDPMAEYFARKKKKESGNKPDLPKYRGPAPAPNRFNIMPGYRWDGLDRSNGFEKKYYENISNKQALKDEFYKWSVGDM
uniref:BUD13 homolog isoform X1 n=1 Tax=Ciona intestinalis TaxID=7719 RepID=UPI000180CFB5|nr:BUD13 homolog isoform X1 [Ciona intestinalis]|eukprot:XP_002132143.1 BUD13 homolog isoform X1 [Ciona intestinalis]